MGLCSSYFDDDDGRPSTGTIASRANSVGPMSTPRFLLTEEDKRVLQRHFRPTMMTQRPDIFHKTMFMCIHASPKLNEIISCEEYCVRDLTQWPKLNKMCQAQANFMERLIYDYDLDEEKVLESTKHLGRIHAGYSAYGFKPHFFDLWQQNLNTNLDRLKMESNEEKLSFLLAFSKLNDFIIDILNAANTEQIRVNLLEARKKLENAYHNPEK